MRRRRILWVARGASYPAELLAQREPRLRAVADLPHHSDHRIASGRPHVTFAPWLLVRRRLQPPLQVGCRLDPRRRLLRILELQSRLELRHAAEQSACDLAQELVDKGARLDAHPLQVQLRQHAVAVYVELAGRIAHVEAHIVLVGDDLAGRFDAGEHWMSRRDTNRSVALCVVEPHAQREPRTCEGADLADDGLHRIRCRRSHAPPEQDVAGLAPETAR